MSARPGRRRTRLGRMTHSLGSVCPTGFAELQTDMTDLTKELNRSQGIPFLEYKHFVTRTFFPKVRSFPHVLLAMGNLAQSTFLEPALLSTAVLVPFLPLSLSALPDAQFSVWKAPVMASMLTRLSPY